MNNLDPYHQLSSYTLSLRDKEFIHQHIVDAYTAQTADSNTKPIALFFSLAGLYLFIEKNFITIQLPVNRGNISAADVLLAPEGHQRDLMIKRWCTSVWNAYAGQHPQIIKAVNGLL